MISLGLILSHDKKPGFGTPHAHLSRPARDDDLSHHTNLSQDSGELRILVQQFEGEQEKPLRRHPSEKQVIVWIHQRGGRLIQSLRWPRTAPPQGAINPHLHRRV